MTRRDPPGKIWRAATGEFHINVPAEMDGQYGSALDLLALKVQPHLWDCSGGHWEPRGEDDARHRLSLAWLGCLLVNECEKARPARRRTLPSKLARRLTAAKRSKLIKEIRSVAEMLKDGSLELFMAMSAASKYVVPSPASDDPIPPGLSAEMRAWLRSNRRLTTSKLADALLAIAHELDGQDHRRNPLGQHERPETTLAAALVTWLRVATGAPWGRQHGEPIPTGGRPLNEVAAAFVRAAGWSMTDSIIKSRLESKKRA
jgi:hypothetical protein